jgi:putative FmdB family regulatory protein
VPVYEFECEKCGDRFEVMLSIKEKHPVKCRHCRGKLLRIFNPVGIVFKGSGFYVNDNRKNGSSSPKNGTPKSETQKSGTATDTAVSSTATTASTETKTSSDKTD